MFTEDCDVVNVVGWWWKGRRQLEAELTPMFQGMFSQSRLTITDVQTRFISSGVAIAHARWTMSGMRMPPVLPEPRAGIQTLVFVKQGGHWLISGFQNTLWIPERTTGNMAKP